MTKLSIVVLALVGVAVPGLSAVAAPLATQQEADRLRSVLERYVGRPAASEAPRLTVTPQGPDYRVTFDLQQMMRPLEPFGVSMDPASQTFVLTPNDSGTWHVAGDAMPPLTVRLKDQTIILKTSTYKYDATFDPKLGFFTGQTLTQDGATMDQEAPALVQHRRSGHSMITQKSVQTDGERESADYSYVVSDTTADMTMRPPPPKGAGEPAPPAIPQMQVSYALPKASLDLHLDRLRSRSLLDLWAFFVAHPSRDALTAAQEDLRGLLRAALPMITGLKETGTAETLAVQTQVGEFKVGRLTSSFDVSDLAGAGKLAAAMSIDGLVLPNLSLPAWSVGLLPTAVDLRPTVTGLHVDEAARAAVEAFDLNKDGLTPDQGRQIGKILIPGNGTFTLATSRITAPLLDLTFEGEGVIGAAPSGRLSVKGTGLDKAIAALQAEAGKDPSAGQVLAQFVAAKALGKPDPDGSILWVIEASGNGPISVNGVPMQ